MIDDEGITLVLYFQFQQRWYERQFIRSKGIICRMSQFNFHHPVEVRYGDLDPQGHVNNAKHLTFFEQARVAYMIKLGLFTKDQSFMEIGIILADVHITYFEPVYFGQKIKVGVHAAKLGKKSMTWEQNIVDADTGKELAKGEVVMVTYDYHEEKTISVPAEWREKISTFERLNV
jgi:acyl-CoA thioester hydrolase